MNILEQKSLDNFVEMIYTPEIINEDYKIQLKSRKTFKPGN